MTDWTKYPFIGIRVDEDLKDAIEKAAKESGQTTVGYVRSVLAASTASTSFKTPKEHTAA